MTGGTVVRAVRAPYLALASLGHAVTFAGAALAAVPYTVRRHRAELRRLLADVCWGSGAIVVGGGVLGVMVLLGAFTGASVGIEGFTALDVIGLSPLTGFVSAFANTREIAPLVAAIAFAAQAGCRFTAQLGAMRISEEIDALESMAVRPMAFLVSTRLLAGLLAVVPLYLVGTAAGYLTTELVVAVGFGQSGGTYQHYFRTFLVPADLGWSVLKAVVFTLLATLVHCYYGYTAAGGPQGVGVAAGRAIRASIVLIVVADMAITVALWGFDPGVRLTG